MAVVPQHSLAQLQEKMLHTSAHRYPMVPHTNGISQLVLSANLSVHSQLSSKKVQ